MDEENSVFEYNTPEAVSWFFRQMPPEQFHLVRKMIKDNHVDPDNIKRIMEELILSNGVLYNRMKFYGWGDAITVEYISFVAGDRTFADFIENNNSGWEPVAE